MFCFFQNYDVLFTYNDKRDGNDDRCITYLILQRFVIGLSLLLSPFSPFYGDAVRTLLMTLVSTTDSYFSLQRWYGILMYNVINFYTTKVRQMTFPDHYYMCFLNNHAISCLLSTSERAYIFFCISVHSTNIAETLLDLHSQP